MVSAKPQVYSYCCSRNNKEQLMIKHLSTSSKFINLRLKLKRTSHVVAASVLAGAAMPLGMFTLQAHAQSVVTFNPIGDTYVTSNAPTANYGSADVLFSSSSAYRAMYKFDTTTIPPTATIDDVWITTYNVNSHTSGGNVYHPLSDSWDENTVTWNTAPTYDSTVLATSTTPTTPGSNVSTELPTTSVTADGNTNYSVTYSTSGLQHQLGSRETTTIYQPKLEVTYTLTGSDTVNPTAPSGLATTSVSGSSVALSWTAGTDNVGVTGYRVYRNGNAIGTTGSTSYTDSTVASGTNYNYSVRAYDADKNYSPATSNLLVGTPGHPTFVDASVDTITSTSVHVSGHINPHGLTTTANFGYGLTSSATSSTSGQNVGSGIQPVGIDATITGLTPNTTYYIRIQGTNSAGGSFPTPFTFTTAP
jgi:hypothetical protein